MTFALCACLVLAAAPAAPATQADIRSAALAAYKAKRYAEACALWEKAKADPDDGSVLADLGLCYGKLGKKKAALDATYAAIAKGEERTRRNAYFNLYTLGVRVKLPEEDRCGALRAPGCKRDLFACTFIFQQYGSGGGMVGTGVRIATEKENAKPDEHAQEPPDVSGLEELDLGPLGVGVIDLLVSAESEDFCRACDEVGDEAKRERCAKDCAKTRIQPVEECSVVVADACVGVIGFVCKQPGAKPEVGEVLMETKE